METKLFKKLKRKFGTKLTYPQLYEIDEMAAAFYAHRTADGYCCACDYDIAVMKDEIKRAKKKSNPTL